jgi:hypothetical protein
MRKKINNWTYSADVKLQTRKMQFEVLPDKLISKPKKLVKYYSLSKNSIDSLINNYLYTSHPFDLNDPFDCFCRLVSFSDIPLDICIRFMQEFNNPREKVMELYNKDKAKLYATMEAIYYDFIYSMMGIISMTQNPLDIKMWAYYTGHKGILVSFKTENLSKILHGPFPINYTSSSEPIKFSEDGFISALYQTNIKSMSWKPEKEWRFIHESFDRMRLPNHPELWDKYKERKCKYDLHDVNEVVLGFSFFDHNNCTDFSNGTATYDFTQFSDRELVVNLLDYLIENKINVSLIYVKDDLTFKLTKKLIQIKRIKDNIYTYKRLQ